LLFSTGLTYANDVTFVAKGTVSFLSNETSAIPPFVLGDPVRLEYTFDVDAGAISFSVTGTTYPPPSATFLSIGSWSINRTEPSVSGSIKIGNDIISRDLFLDQYTMSHGTVPTEIFGGLTYDSVSLSSQASGVTPPSYLIDESLSSTPPDIGLAQFMRVEPLIYDDNRNHIFVVAAITQFVFVEDSDSDSIPDDRDNCPLDANLDQADWDSNGIGDVCDDSDSDGIYDSVDNCPLNANSDQADRDGDGRGDQCDGEGTSGKSDADNDGIINRKDNCLNTSNFDQADLDGDGIGDACDTPLSETDIDFDTINDDVDNCPLDPNTNQEDQDGDGIGDSCDDDVDGDGVRNKKDKCPIEGGNVDRKGCPVTN